MKQCFKLGLRDRDFLGEWILELQLFRDWGVILSCKFAYSDGGGGIGIGKGQFFWDVGRILVDRAGKLVYIHECTKL